MASNEQGEYQIIKEGQEEVLRVNANSWNFIPSIEENPIVMGWTIDRLVETPSVSRIVFNQKRNYIYDYDQTKMLIEIANVYKMLVRQKNLISLAELELNIAVRRFIPEWRANLQNILLNLLKFDPIGAYVELKRYIREEEIKLENASLEEAKGIQDYVKLLTYVYKILELTTLIQKVRTRVDGYDLDDRSLYFNLFRPSLAPDFMHTRLMAQHPLRGVEKEIYEVDNSEVNIYDTPDDIKPMYHLTPPEFKLTEDKYELLDLARNVLAEHKPREEEFLDPTRMRRTFKNIGQDMLQELADSRGIPLKPEELENLSNILVRYTVGFGLIEELLKDEKIQDITINSPIGQSPVFIVHQDYDECYTNIFPSVEDSESWASKFRLLSGRPLDEANPVLDTELLIPGARARVAIVQKPLNPHGISFSFRRHRDKPWTFPLFIKNRMIDSLGAGLLSFLIDGSRSLLFAGTRSSGKTSLLGSSLIEIMRKYRIITIEDSVSGDSNMVVEKKGRLMRTTIGKLTDDLIDKYGCWYNLSGNEILGNDENIKVFSMNKEGKIKLSRVSKFIRHRVKKPLYEITTRTGRKIKVTGDHSLFGLRDNAEIKEIKVNYLEKGDYIATPRKIENNNKNLDSINLLSYIDKIDKGYLFGEEVKLFLIKNKFEVTQLGKEYGHNRSLRSRWFREGIIPMKILKDMCCLNYNLKEIKNAFFKYSGNSKAIPINIELDEDLLTFIGLWIADGCYDKNSVIISASSKEERGLVSRVANKFGFKVKIHSDNFSSMINSNTFKFFMREILELKGNAYTKRIPNSIFSLSNEQISFVLRGLFSGDGCVGDKEIVIPLASLNLLKDIQTLLLNYGIILRIGKKRKDKTYNAGISTLRSWKIFKEKIDLLQERKTKRLSLLCEKKSTHDTTDIIPLSRETKFRITKFYNKFNSNDYLVRNNNLGRMKLNSILNETILENRFINRLHTLAKSDLFWDQIKDIKCINDYEGFVYDISVPGDESFICDNIVAHNTLELPGDSLRKLGYNIQSLKVRSALTKGGSEISADEGIRTSLRMGDSSLIVGEIRSTEAFALYEAMRIGALANVVAGTIHGDSPYGVFDRVVNDLKVPATSFKATDIIVISNPVKSSDGLHKWRRVMQITEVRKHWKEDPIREHGFIDLLKYNSKTDTLEPTPELMNGDSDTLKAIASNVKEWAGDWDALWNNILLRGRIKQALVDYSARANLPDLLEAKFVIDSNDQFHRISDTIKEEVGSLSNDLIYNEWEAWLKRRIKEFKF